MTTIRVQIFDSTGLSAVKLQNITNLWLLLNTEVSFCIVPLFDRPQSQLLCWPTWYHQEIVRMKFPLFGRLSPRSSIEITFLMLNKWHHSDRFFKVMHVCKRYFLDKSNTGKKQLITIKSKKPKWTSCHRFS